MNYLCRMNDVCLVESNQLGHKTRIIKLCSDYFKLIPINTLLKNGIKVITN